ncbi:MAG TPA: hypothetical protein VMI06_04755, partial [Terriglobia bacterium]|nr:hypothetical protein [Terriglobia bacterium]
ESLALLKTTGPGAKGLACPPDDVWLEIAAGIVHQDSEDRVNHAAECDHCGPLLRQAKEDFADELTPGEDGRIATLSISTADGQERLAIKLQNNPAPSPIVTSPKGRPPISLSSFLAPWRLAFAAALIALILLGIRDYRRVAHLSAGNLQTAAEVRRLEQTVLQQNRQIAELTSKPRVSKIPSTVPPPQPAGSPQIASLVLDSGVTRGIGALKRLTVPKGADVARITLRSGEALEGIVREELITAEGQKKWSQELSPSETEKRTGSLSLLVPAYLLTPNDYQIVLSRQSSGGFEHFATYTFRITR